MRISGQITVPGTVSIKFALAGFAAFLLAGCSDSIERFGTSYNNPSDSDPVYTASIPKIKKVGTKYKAPIYQNPQVAAQEPETIVQSPIAHAPLTQNTAAKYNYSQSYQKTYRQPKLVAQAPVVNAPAQPKYAFNNAPTYKPPVIQEEQASADETVVQPIPVKKPVLALKKQTAASITVGPGMTLYGIAKANHLSVQKLATANRISAPFSLAQGQVLKIPGSAAAVEPTVAEAKPPVKPALAMKPPAANVAEANSDKVSASAGQASEHVVASGDTLFSLGRKYNVSPFAIADLNGFGKGKSLSLGQKLKIPANSVVVATKTSGDAQPTQLAAKPAALALPKQDASSTQVAEAAPAVEPVAQLSMRWPLRGKVISAFGPKTNGMKNEGINIAVPEGTNIQAAEAGVVAYAGNELKGYGNLVLIRHSGGYVTAYAHASQLLVKKGDQITRGQVIAKAGQTGAVQSPQLHFEVRKGATALDPAKFLGSATAMN